MYVNRFSSLKISFLTALLGFLAYRIMNPFFTAIAWAMVFSIIFYPVYAAILRYIRIREVASSATILIILIILIGPTTYLSNLLITEMRVFMERITPERIESVKGYWRIPMSARAL